MSDIQSGASSTGRFSTVHTGHVSATQKRKLDFVKCERCRRDKQKCKPEHRRMPQKCDRCGKNGWPCSEGTKKIRTSKLRHRLGRHALAGQAEVFVANAQSCASIEARVDAAVGVPVLAVNDFPVESYVEVIELQKWSFLMSFHKNMIMAVNGLNALRCQTLARFSISGSHLKSVPAEFQLPAERSFLNFVSRIYEELCTRSLGIIRNRQHGAISIFVSASLANISALSRTWNSPDSCPISTPIRIEHDLHAEMKNRSDPFDRFLNQLNQCALSCPGDENLYQHQKVKELSSAANAQATLVLQDLDLLAFLPGESRASPLFVPDSALRMTVDDKSAYESRVDCLGRSSLLRSLDAHGETTGVFHHLYTQERSRQMEYQDILGRSPLHLACQYIKYFHVRAIIESGANLNGTTFYGSTTLHYAVTSRDNLLLLYSLLEESKLNVNAIDLTGRSALWYAVEKGDVETVRFLLRDKRIEVDLTGVNWIKPSQDGIETPLSRAAWLGQEHIARLLLEKGANPNGKGIRTPIWSCLESPNRTVNMFSLLAKHPDININEVCPGNQYQSPLAHIARTKWTEGARILHELHRSSRLSLNFNAIDAYGNTPLSLAVLSLNKELITLLADEQWRNMADFNHRNFKGNDAATIAMNIREPKIAKLLESVAVEQRSRRLYVV